MTREAAFRSKVLVPRRSSGVIRRDRLLTRLSIEDAPPLAVIVAPAGYGKTTLLTDLAHDTPGSVAWLTLDEWDRDPVTFLGYLRLAVSGWPEQGDGRTVTPTAEGLHEALAAIAEALVAENAPSLVVLDDFHLVEDSSEVVSQVNYLVQHLPPGVRLVLASRRQPPLQGLPRLRLVGSVLDYGTSDLVFTNEEIREFYRAAGMELAPEAVEKVARLTHGWPAGIALLKEPASANGEPSREMSDYLSAEVLSGLEREVYDFLLETCVLESLDGRACEALRGKPSGELLERVARSSVPMVRLEADGTALRIHPLVREALCEKLRTMDAQRYRELHRLAGKRAESAGQASEAIAHLASAEEWDEVSRLIMQEAPKFYRLGRWHTVAAWLRSVPPARLDEHPGLRLWEARILARLGQLDGALRVISESAPRVTDPVRVAQFETVRAAALRAKGGAAAAITAGRRAVDLAMKHNAPISVVAEARKEYALALVAEGSFEEAVEEFRAILGFQDRTGRTEETAFINSCLGSALGALGRLSESTEYLERARQQWQTTGNTKELTYTLNNLGVTYHRMGQTAMASDLLQQALAKSVQSGNRRAESYALASIGDLEMESGDARAAERAYGQAYEIAAELGDMTALTHARCGLALCKGALGQGDEGVTIARQALLSAKERGSAYEQGVALAAIGRIERQRGRLQEAVTALSEATAMFERTAALRELGQALLLLGAAALPLRGSRGVARLSLERFLTLSGQLGEATKNMAPAEEITRVIEYGASRKIGGDFYRRMLRELRGAERESAPAMAHPASGSLPLVRLRALGAFEVTVDGRAIQSMEWESEKSKELFLLLATAGRALSRGEVVAHLWPESGGQRASSSFHSTLHRVRKATYRELVVESAGKYSLNPSARFQSDVADFEDSLAMADDPSLLPGGDLKALRRAVDLYGGPFAPGFEAEWIDSRRGSLEERFLRAALRLSRALFDAGDYGEAAAVCERIMEVDPYNETSCHLMMQAYAATGDTESALRAYRRLSETLEVELGEAPGEPLQQLQSEIRSLVGRP